MNKVKQSILAIVIGLVLSAGVSYAEGIWKNPEENPPNKNTDAPINVGREKQTKAGGLFFTNPIEGGIRVNGSANFGGVSQFTSDLIITSGSPGVGKVLTSTDIVGTVSWQMPTTQTAYTPDLIYKDRNCNTTDCEISCPSGYKAISGGWAGWRFDNIDCSHPINGGKGWKVCNTNETNFPWQLHVVCIK